MLLLLLMITAINAIEFDPSVCLFQFTNPIFPSFVLPPPQPNSPGDIHLNPLNPIRMSNRSINDPALHCNSRQFSYFDSTSNQFTSEYRDTTGRLSTIKDQFYVNNHDQLFIRTIQVNQNNLAWFLSEKLLKLDLVCNGGLTSCLYFTVNQNGTSIETTTDAEQNNHSSINYSIPLFVYFSLIYHYWYYTSIKS